MGDFHVENTLYVNMRCLPQRAVLLIISGKEVLHNSLLLKKGVF